MTMTMFGYLISISTDFLRSYFSIFSLVLVSIEKIYQTLKTVFDISLQFTKMYGHKIIKKSCMGFKEEIQLCDNTE